VSVGLVPSLALLWFFVCEDRNPEPPWAVWKAFLAGIGAVAIAIVLEAQGEGVLGALGPDSIIAAVVTAMLLAGVFEEVAKWLILRWFANRTPEFDEPMDGIVYGVAIGLGFAVVEDAIYVMRSTDAWFEMLTLRGFTAMPVHVGLGAITGYYVGTATFPRLDARAFNRAWRLAAVLHGLYDLPLLMGSLPRFQPTGFRIFFWSWAGLVLIVICVLAVRLSRKLHADQLAHPELKDPLQLNHSWRAWAEMIGGSGLVAAILGFGVALLGHRANPEELPLDSVQKGVGLFLALAGIVAGVLLYRAGMRRLYRGAHPLQGG
jgi:RsiW-degrading membrane proteinase PrsW (M82 family)